MKYSLTTSNLRDTVTFFLICTWICYVVFISFGCTPSSPRISKNSELISAFVEVTDQSGLSYRGRSYGASWGDANKDGWPDLFVSNHSKHKKHPKYDPPYLYTNLRDRTFRRDTLSFMDASDLHAAAWADFDKDGDQDLIVLSGGTSRNLLFLNLNGQSFIESAVELGIELDGIRGRTPLWIDKNGDGWIDLLVGGEAALKKSSPSSALFQNTFGFLSKNTAFENKVFSMPSRFSQISRTGVGNEWFIAHNGTKYFDLNGNSANFSYAQKALKAHDGFFEDLDGNLTIDQYSSMGIFELPWNRGSKVKYFQDKPTSLKILFRNKQKRKSLSFHTNGNINIELNSVNKDLRYHKEDRERLIRKVFIGKNKVNPDSTIFKLSPVDTINWGIIKSPNWHLDGVYIGYNPNKKVWKISVDQNERKTSITPFSLNIYSSENIYVNIKRANKTVHEIPQDSIRFNLLTSFEKTSPILDQNELAIQSVSSVAGDFDNDMDIDIYLVRSGLLSNLPNILLENRGNGTFETVEDAGGATGSEEGLGESVTTVDYNQDGFLDLFLTNGRSWLKKGPNQLFQNKGNNNFWLEIDLEGTESNRDGIGCSVIVYAGGIAQLRQQTGGMHRYSQNHSRLHFGLGQHSIIDSIKVDWPSGKEQWIKNIAANQILKILEP